MGVRFGVNPNFEVKLKCHWGLVPWFIVFFPLINKNCPCVQEKKEKNFEVK